MSKVGISLSINVSEIEKGRIFKGKKGNYLDMTVFVDLDQADQYGNHGMIVQSTTKDEKQNGVKGKILGNCKVFWKGESQQQAPQQNQPQQQATANDFDNSFDDDIPF